jgi:hypothetical protein
MLLQMQATSQFLLTMSDATGFNSGGTTSLLTVGASVGGSSCNTTNSAIAFSFQLNSALIQCRPFVFTGYADTGAVQPVTIAAFIPGGTAFELNPPVGSTSFSWNANVNHGTSLIFSMTDAQGGQGGSSDIRAVGVSDDNSCLDNSSPSSTLAAPSPTASTPSSSNPSSGPSAPPSAPSHGISIAAIAGTVIASLLFLAVIITLGLFFLRKKLSQSSGNTRKLPGTLESEIDLSFDSLPAPAVTPYNVPQSYDRPYSSDANPSFDANPFRDPSQSVTHYQLPSQYFHPGTFQSPSQHYPLLSGHTPQNPVTDSSAPSLSRTEFEPIPLPSTPSTSASQRKAAIAGVNAHQPSRFIVHTDADDDLPQPNNDGVIELPPQYSQRRILGVANPTPDPNAGHPPGSFRS